MRKETYKKLPSLKKLNEAFIYKDGYLFWKESSKYKHFLNGKRAGSISKLGYRIVCLDNVLYFEHRIIFKMIKGKQPKYQIDHLDGNKINNKIENLIESNPFLNTKNARKRIDNKSGFSGIFLGKIVKNGGHL